MRTSLSVALLAVLAGGLTACGGHSATTGSAGSTAPPTVSGSKSGGSATPGGSATAAGQLADLRGKVIALDPGHNGGNAAEPTRLNRQVFVGNGYKGCDTTGTETKAGYAEHAFTWDVVQRMQKLLKAAGAKVVLTRQNDHSFGPCVTQRSAIGNNAHADAALSVHADGAPSGDHGFHIIEPGLIKGYNDAMVKPSRRLGQDLHNAYLSGTGIVNSTYLGKKGIDVRTDLGGLNLSKVPKVFIECGNMANPGDAAKLSSASFRQKIAQSLVNGFASYFAS